MKSFQNWPGISSTSGGGPSRMTRSSKPFASRFPANDSRRRRRRGGRGGGERRRCRRSCSSARMPPRGRRRRSPRLGSIDDRRPAVARVRLVTPGRRFRELLSTGETILVPGAYNALVARVLEQAGFGAIYTEGLRSRRRHIRAAGHWDHDRHRDDRARRTDHREPVAVPSSRTPTPATASW